MASPGQNTRSAISVRIPSSGEGLTPAGEPLPAPSQPSQPRRSIPSNLGPKRRTPLLLESARKIEECWINYRNKQMFRLLKTAVIAAEHSLSTEILRKIAPKEANFFKDDSSSKFKIRFRFGGAEFPPNIYFKIYVASEGACTLKYVTGKKVIKAHSVAAEDALKRMGARLYYGQMLRDAMHRQEHRIAEEYEVSTLKDYMQYSSLLDEMPAYLGGRDNGWRRLSMDCLPRRTIFHDLVAYMASKNVTQRLRDSLPFLLARPLTPNMALDQLKLITEVWPAEEQLQQQQQAALAKQMSSRSQETARRSRRALSRAERMRKAFTREPSKESFENRQKSQDLSATDVVAVTGDGPLTSLPIDSVDEEEEDWMEAEAGTLYQWTRDLTLDDFVRTPRLPTDIPMGTPQSVPPT